MEDWVVLLVVDVGRKMDFDDGMKNNGMENRNSMDDVQDLLEMVDNPFFIFHQITNGSKFDVKQTYRVDDDSPCSIDFCDDGEIATFYFNNKKNMS
jgi:hypothetical protein